VAQGYQLHNRPVKLGGRYRSSLGRLLLPGLVGDRLRASLALVANSDRNIRNWAEV